MLFQDLKRVASDCCFNPRKPTKPEKILLDVGNPTYWTTRAQEYLASNEGITVGSALYKANLKAATKLLILTQAYFDGKTKKPRKARVETTTPDKGHASS